MRKKGSASKRFVRAGKTHCVYKVLSSDVCVFVCVRRCNWTGFLYDSLLIREMSVLFSERACNMLFMD